MSCCCGEVEKDPEEEKVTEKSDFAQEEDNDFGPTPNRGCTDAWCLIVLVAAWIAYIVVTVMGMADGNPSRLYQPRDFQGAYCDVESNWNNGTNLLGYTKQSFTMNVSSVTDVIVKQMMCSTAFRTAMVDGYTGIPAQAALLSGFEAEDYLCACCLIPCGPCQGSLNVGGDLTDVASVSTVITAKLEELRGKVSADNLFSPSGANGQVFEDIFNEASLYFNEVCLTGCAADFTMVNGSSTAREYVYEMTLDNPLKLAFDTLKSYSGSRAEVLSLQHRV
ncbi:SLC44A5 [Symbiodinium natans]|uniref:SLC44A5 protein n=1 Tax=Symbiodinium natans TaxID=878477 RepID=A0A812NJD1_9DINO|nr:SLC44A5 [Symbiodinium natans]